MFAIKMENEDFDTLALALYEVHKNVDLADQAEDFQAKGLSPMRFRWAVLDVAKIRPGHSVGTPTGWNVYDYLNDDHIDSALKLWMRDYAGIDWAAQ